MFESDSDCLIPECTEQEKMIKAFEIRFRERFTQFALATDVIKEFRTCVSNNNFTVKQIYDFGNMLLMCNNNQILAYLNV